ncbi:hypothetical protein EVAR_53901_1 [Eumeta japonica]|uniref:Uncharacterized protein n=1 Tax=Eumeta variegata TaxID=151549 RepID=A0A4C1YF89_EUMVA|nr:hypothetical protein EVAR_53901_1 [Eumeta japonica]
MSESDETAHCALEIQSRGLDSNELKNPLTGIRIRYPLIRSSKTVIALHEIRSDSKSGLRLDKTTKSVPSGPITALGRPRIARRRLFRHFRTHSNGLSHDKFSAFSACKTRGRKRTPVDPTHGAHGISDRDRRYFGLEKVRIAKLAFETADGSSSAVLCS